MDQLCSKCRGIFLAPFEPEIALPFRDIDPTLPDESQPLHSDSIASLFASKSLPCHLCVLIWQARSEYFDSLLQREREADGSQNRGRAELRWMAMSLGERLMTLYFSIRQNLIRENVEGLDVVSWDLDQAPWRDFDFDIESNRMQNQIHFGIEFVIPGSSTTPKYNSDNISKSTNSDETVKLMKYWISTCKSSVTSHEYCNKWHSSRENWNPTRVLDVRALSAPSQVKLFQPDIGSNPITYLTLSHRWGKQNVLALTTLNIQELTRQIPLHSLSKTFRDAINITRRLGIRYLWIDSLCIVQDSDEDWQLESARMGDVYKFGLCNLAATRASGGSFDGLYVERDPLPIKPLLLDIQMKSSRAGRITTETQTRYIHPEFNEWTEVNTATLNKRAWVLQERIMSPRTLHFCSNQVMFECSYAQCSETFPRLSSHVDHFDLLDYPSKGHLASLTQNPNSEKAMDFWARIIKYYPTMNLSVETDRLVALSGIAKSVNTCLKKQEYVAGFWSRDLLSQLLWYVESPAIVKDHEKTSGYVAPSWSWTSARNQIDNKYLLFYGHKSYTALVGLMEHGTTPIADSLGQIKDGFLKLRGPMTKGLVGMHVNPEEGRMSQQSSDIRNKDSVLVAAFFDRHEALPLEQVYCLPLFMLYGKLLIRSRDRLYQRKDVTGLLLLQTGRKPGEFKRCGMFETSWQNVKPLKAALKKFCKEAASSGIPFRKTWRGNEFVITIV